MIVVGLTGGIGAGKSTFAGLLRERGAEVVDVDAIGRAVIAPDGPGAAAVMARFGTLDRRELAGLVFADEEARRDLERISWPIIEDAIRARVAASAAETVVLDMAVLPQGLGKGMYGPVVTVEAPEGLRLARLVDRGMSVADARARMNAQVSAAVRRRLAAITVINDGTVDDLSGKVDAVLALLGDLAGRQ